jgi:hypothetical protein
MSKLDSYGNVISKEDWSELDHILAARHHKRKAEVKLDVKQLMLKLVEQCTESHGAIDGTELRTKIEAL